MDSNFNSSLVNSVMIGEDDDDFIPINELEAQPQRLKPPNVSHNYHPSQSVNHLDRHKQDDGFSLHEDYTPKSHRQEPKSRQELVQMNEVSSQKFVSPRYDHPQRDENIIRPPLQEHIEQINLNPQPSERSFQSAQAPSGVQKSLAVKPQLQLVQKKREAYQNAKVHEEATKHIIDTHRELLDDMFACLEKRAQQSTKTLNVIIEFLASFNATQRNSLAFYQQKQISQAFSEKEGLAYPAMNNALIDLQTQQQQRSKQIQGSIDMIQSVIDSRLKPNSVAFSDKIKEFAEEFQKGKKLLGECATSLKKYTEKFAKIYSDMMANNGVHKKRTKDLLHSEKKYMRALNGMLVQQSAIGQQIYNYMTTLLALEKARYQLIQDVLITYEDMQQFDTSAMRQLMPEKETVINLTPTQVGTIQKALNLVQVGVPEIKYYLADYLPSVQGNSDYLSHSLVRFSCNQVLQDVGSFLAEWRQVTIVLSEDNHLIVLEEHSIRHKFQVERVELIKKSNNPVIVSLKHTIPGLLFSSTQTIQLKFPDIEFYDQLVQQLK